MITFLSKSQALKWKMMNKDSWFMSHKLWVIIDDSHVFLNLRFGIVLELHSGIQKCRDKIFSIERFNFTTLKGFIDESEFVIFSQSEADISTNQFQENLTHQHMEQFWLVTLLIIQSTSLQTYHVLIIFYLSKSSVRDQRTSTCSSPLSGIRSGLWLWNKWLVDP